MIVIRTLLVLCFFEAVSAGSIIPKVVNGTDADISEFPFMVSLRKSPLGAHHCGGSLINELWVLSAAHCLQNPPSIYTVQYSKTTIFRDDPTAIQVAEVIPHEEYLPANQYIHDIGLVRLEEPISNPLSGFKIRLPFPGTYFYTGTPAVLSGWGLNATEGSLMTTLQSVELQIFSVADCAKLHNDKIHPSNICGGVVEGGKGQCSGDSGGPLLVDGVQVGIVSWSEKPCTIAPFPGKIY